MSKDYSTFVALQQGTEPVLDSPYYSMDDEAVAERFERINVSQLMMEDGV